MWKELFEINCFYLSVHLMIKMLRKSEKWAKPRENGISKKKKICVQIIDSPSLKYNLLHMNFSGFYFAY